MAALVSPAVSPENRVPPERLAMARAVPVSDIVGRHVTLKRIGREWVGHCPFHRDRSPSFTVVDSKGFFHCFGCGTHGDVVEFIRRFERLSFVEAVERVVGSQSNQTPHDRDSGRQVRSGPDATGESRSARGAHWWQDLWRSARPAAGTLTETYLQRRGIVIEAPRSLRFVPRLRHAPSGPGLPAMVAAFQDVAGDLTGIHRTYLSLDGRSKADVEAPKRMAGRCWGCAIRLAAAAETLAIAEGIETGLSVMQAVPGLAVWVAGSLGNLAGAGRGEGRPHPEHDDRRLPSEESDLRRPGLILPSSVRRIIILADADGDPHVGAALTERALRKFQALGLTASIAWPRPGMDFNDMLRGEL